MNRRLSSTILVVVFLIHSGLLAFQGYRNAPNLDESAHLAAGVSHWEFGDFSLYRVNPPLVRMWATMPLLVERPKISWQHFSDAPRSRAEFAVGGQFNRLNGPGMFWYVSLARWALIPLSLIGAMVCYCWASELFGAAAGLLAATLWCFCPNLLAWGASITPDMGSAVTGVLAAWRFWCWLKKPSWTQAALAGTALGVAELTKSTWVILFGLWPLVFCICCAPTLFTRWKPTGLAQQESSHRPSFRQLILVLSLALYLLNLGYGFQDSGCRLGDFTFISKTLGGEDAHEHGGNRFKESWLSSIPIPLPANYILGIDVQKYDFERGKWSWLRGKQKLGGWWYYYLYAILVKTPLGFLGLFGLSIAAFTASRFYRSPWRNELMIVLPGLAVLLLVSSQTGFNRYLRYALPVYPFLYVFASRMAVAFHGNSRTLPVVVVVLMVGGIASSLSVAPHSMSYFNQMVGGPRGGHRHLLDGNLDWGQDLKRLKEWMEAHPEAAPLQTALTTFVPLDAIGMDAILYRPEKERDASTIPPGWYAISVNPLMGYRMLPNSPDCRHFLALTPVDVIGYTIYIYHVED